MFVKKAAWNPLVTSQLLQTQVRSFARVNPAAAGYLSKS